MELTKKENKILKECRGEGYWGAYLRMPWAFPLVFLVVVTLAYFVSPFKENGLTFVFAMTGTYVFSSARLLFELKVLINKLANRIEELEKKK